MGGIKCSVSLLSPGTLSLGCSWGSPPLRFRLPWLEWQPQLQDVNSFPGDHNDQPQLRNTALANFSEIVLRATLLFSQSNPEHPPLAHLNSGFAPVWFIPRHLNCHLTVLITLCLLSSPLVLHFLTIVSRHHFFFYVYCLRVLRCL